MYLDIPIVHQGQSYEKDDKAPIVGPSSYKEHGFRMLMIWASGLNPDVPLTKELCEALSAVDKKAVAGIYINSLFFYYYCYPIVISTNFLPRVVKIFLIHKDNIGITAQPTFTEITITNVIYLRLNFI